MVIHTSGHKPHGDPNLVFPSTVPRFPFFLFIVSRRTNSRPSSHLCSLAILVQFEVDEVSASNRKSLPLIDIHLLRTVGPLAQLSLWFANWASILPVTTPSVWTTRSVLPQPISNLSLTLTPAVACRWSTFFALRNLSPAY